MSWNVEFTDEYRDWFAHLTAKQQNSVMAHIHLLEEKGPNLPFPYSSGVSGSKHDHMRELRVQSKGHPIRIFYAFEQRRSAILLVGGNKTGDNRFYKTYVPLADRLYDRHLASLKKKRT